jgi:hypothetical protein
VLQGCAAKQRVSHVRAEERTRDGRLRHAEFRELLPVV